MATLPTTKRISKEDIKGSPSWFDPFLSMVNNFFLAIYDALNGQLTFVENISAIIREVNFTTESDYISADNWNDISIKNTLRKKASGVFILQLSQVEDNYTPLTNAASLDWIEINGNIIIGFISGLDNLTTYSLKVMVI